MIGDTAVVCLDRRGVPQRVVGDPDVAERLVASNDPDHREITNYVVDVPVGGLE